MGVPPCKALGPWQVLPNFAARLPVCHCLVLPAACNARRRASGSSLRPCQGVRSCGGIAVPTWACHLGQPSRWSPHPGWSWTKKCSKVYLDSKLTEIKGGYSFCNTSHMVFWGIGIQPTKINSIKTMPNYASTWLSNSRVRLSDWPFIETPFSTQKNMVNWCDVLRFWEQTSSIIFVYSHKKKDQKGLFELTPGGPFRVRQSPWNSNKGMLEKFAVDLGMHQNLTPMTPIDFGKLE